MRLCSESFDLDPFEMHTLMDCIFAIGYRRIFHIDVYEKLVAKWNKM